jgi:hypothetical protein
MDDPNNDDIINILLIDADTRKGEVVASRNFMANLPIVYADIPRVLLVNSKGPYVSVNGNDVNCEEISLEDFSKQENLLALNEKVGVPEDYARTLPVFFRKQFGEVRNFKIFRADDGTLFVGPQSEFNKKGNYYVVGKNTFSSDSSVSPVYYLAKITRGVIEWADVMPIPSGSDSRKNSTWVIVHDMRPGYNGYHEVTQKSESGKRSVTSLYFVGRLKGSKVFYNDFPGLDFVYDARGDITPDCLKSLQTQTNQNYEFSFIGTEGFVISSSDNRKELFKMKGQHLIPGDNVLGYDAEIVKMNKGAIITSRQYDVKRQLVFSFAGFKLAQNYSVHSFTAKRTVMLIVYNNGKIQCNTADVNIFGEVSSCKKTYEEYQYNPKKNKKEWVVVNK